MARQTLTVRQKPADKPVGLFRVYMGRKPVAAVVITTVQLHFGLRPSDADIRSAVQQVTPALGVTDAAVVKWED